ncbi:Pentatricopeptide repeat-containing protein [Apostasia shenzhenica]|uniref:Pentatricopeptide repeat-containing protein n=1 Tax=Apostasia shenzhenica TaxID=1088818 RepID=A0A2I0BFU4_9ASPA|nr:Pentatricopeptide repeat-containing protein [Apostasia shenzhenica]
MAGVARLPNARIAHLYSNPYFSPKHHCLSLLTSISAMSQLLQIHAHLLTSGLLFTDKFLVSEILRFAALHPSGDLLHARTLLFQSPSPMSSSWNHVIRGLCLTPSPAEAVEVFLQMRRREATPNELTYPFVIKSCADLPDLWLGRQVHADAFKNAVGSIVYVENTLIHLYGSCGVIDDSRKVFDKMPNRTVVSWNTILSVYVDNLMVEEAWKTYGKMMNRGFESDQTTYLVLLCASALMGSLRLGRWVHSQIIYKGFSVSLKLGTALVNMYAKCGAVNVASNVFDRMPERNVWSWSAIILGLAQHGSAGEALDLFRKMRRSSLIEPNNVTFLGVLCACSHAGLVSQGYQFFHEMINVHRIKPQMSHYRAMVDILSRKGLLLEAFEFIKVMQIDPDAVVWRTLLSACQLHSSGDAYVIGDVAKKMLLMLEPDRCENYVIVANMYSEHGSWEEAAKVRKMMREDGMQKMAGESCIEVSG